MVIEEVLQQAGSDVLQPPQMLEAVLDKTVGKYSTTGYLRLTDAGVESLSQMQPGVSYRIRSVELNQLMGKDENAVATILGVDGLVVSVEYPRDEPFTDAERREALKDPDLPEAVKQALRKLIYGDKPRLTIKKMSSPKPIGPGGKSKPLIALNKTRRPEGMSGRQWRQYRKTHNRTMAGIARGQIKPV